MGRRKHDSLVGEMFSRNVSTCIKVFSSGIVGAAIFVGPERSVAVRRAERSGLLVTAAARVR